MSNERRVVDDEARWQSAKIRMARMVEPHGCDALVDHIFVFRAPYGEWREPVLAAGRRLEREEPGTSRIEWRFAEILTTDILHADALDGAEVYAKLLLEPAKEEVIAYGTAFHPEQSTPVRQRLMTVGAHDGSETEAAWFSAKLRIAAMVEGAGSAILEDSVYIFRATDFDAALDAAIRRGRQQEHGGVNLDGQKYHWAVVEVQSLNLLGAGEIGDAVEVYREAVPLRDTDRVPFDFVFVPERSEPNSTGV